MENIALRNEDHVLAYTQNKREEIITALSQNGMPTDTEVLGVMLKTLKDMDGAALTRKKIKVDEKVVDTQAQTANMIGDLLMRLPNMKVLELNTPGSHVIPTLGDDVERPKLVADETSTTLSNETHNDFMARMNPQALEKTK